VRQAVSRGQRVGGKEQCHLEKVCERCRRELRVVDPGVEGMFDLVLHIVAVPVDAEVSEGMGISAQSAERTYHAQREPMFWPFW
jgi:hypothetical protein